jgi:hypothetical protein
VQRVLGMIMTVVLITFWIMLAGIATLADHKIKADHKIQSGVSQ